MAKITIFPAKTPTATVSPEYIKLSEVADKVFLPFDKPDSFGYGLRVYLGENKTYMFEIMGGGDCPDMPSGQGYLVRYREGDTEWKDKEAMENLDLYIPNNGSIDTREWKVYNSCP